MASYLGHTMRAFFNIFNYLTLLALLITPPGPGFAQAKLMQDAWLVLETAHFTVLSQRSARQTARFADELETWRQIAAYVIQGQSPFPSASIPNYVYLFDTEESFQFFSYPDEKAFFHPSP